MWKLLGEKIELEPPEPFHGSTYLGVVQRDVENNDDQIRSKQELMKTLLTLKTQVNQDAEHNYLNLDDFDLGSDRPTCIKSFIYDMCGHADAAVQRYL